MRMSRFHAPTLREAPREAEVPSHKLLLRAGYMRPLAAGIYDFLPLGVRAVRRISTIVREEMDEAGALEVELPAVQPADLWYESGRWTKYGPELLRFEDRKGHDYCMGPTHEEVIVDLVRRDVGSYRALPVNLYQIQTKFRDELRPRAGLMRGREFLMKDAYSFDADEAGAERSYEEMFETYERIFRRCGLDFRSVEAPTGAIGGSRSHEFHVLADTGEDAIVSCDGCPYTANVELAEVGGWPEPLAERAEGDWERVETPGRRTVEDVTAQLGVEASALIKTLLVVADEQVWAVLVRGDRELNLLKVQQALGAEEVEMADAGTVRERTGAPVGFAGPVGIDVPILADPEVAAMREAVTGGNEAEVHLRGVIPGRHFDLDHRADVRVAEPGDVCPRCGGTLRGYRGIEVGHVFFLGTNYAEPMGCTFLDREGTSQPMVMGCYGIGITRILAAAVEQNHDERGIVWPMPLAPFQVAVVGLGKGGDEVDETAGRLHDELRERGIEVLWDDRGERPGVKFADADLMGHPLQLVVGRKGLQEGVVELKTRRDGSTERIAVEEAADAAAARVREAMREAAGTSGRGA